MTPTKQRQRSVTSNYTPTHQAAPPGRALRLLPLGVTGVGLAVFACTPPGVRAATGIFGFLAFYAGVFSLVALSITVMIGLIATDRLVLLVRHRVLMQSIHRAFATTAVIFLGIHILIKIAEGHASVADVVVPFLEHHRTIYIGLGTIAGYLMVAVTVTGIVRSRFAGSARPWLWRTLHATAYLCWPIALLHGLNAGRPAKSWVTTSYALCLILTGVALLIRVWTVWTRHLAAPRTRTSAVQRPTPAAETPDWAKPVGRWANSNTDTITDEEFWSYLREELRK